MIRKLLVLVIVVAVLFSGCSFFDGSNSLDRLLGNEEQKNHNYPEFSSVTQFRDHIMEQRQQGELSISFVYTGTDEIDPGVVAQIADVCFVRMTVQGNFYHFELTAFPGERMVDAYFRDDTQLLSQDEKKALKIAIQMVEEAKSQVSNDWELELLIHDMLAERITYSNADIYYESPEDQPRHLSAIGALLDGEANCQGYTDAFYVLATIAGFEVGRLSVETDKDPHMVNTICLDRKWYVVDLTYDDSNDEIDSYRLFNVGLDMIGREYSWDEKIQKASIEKVSDANSYFIRNDLVFGDLEELAEYIAEEWAQNGTEQIMAMVQNETDSEKLNDVLPELLEKWGKSYSYSIWHNSNGIDSFYTVVFE